MGPAEGDPNTDEGEGFRLPQDTACQPAHQEWVWNINQKSNIDPIQISSYYKEVQYLLFVLLLSSLCFKDYIIQMLALISYILLKPHPEVL